MESKQIQAIGNLLTYYETDLNYIKEFHNFKNGKISLDDYCEKIPGSFYSFLIEFRVIRNLPKGKIKELLSETYIWINSDESNNVDLFAKTLNDKNLTNGIMASLASKILFLNNPWGIIPMDRLARKTLSQKDNNYKIYEKNLDIFRNDKKEILENSLEYVYPLSKLIHKKFQSIESLDIICNNRIMDKLLWTLGKNN